MVAVDGEGMGTGHWMDTGHRVRRIRERSDPVKSGEFSSRIVGGVAKCAVNQRPGAWEVGEVAVDGERLVGSRGVAEVGARSGQHGTGRRAGQEWLYMVPLLCLFNVMKPWQIHHLFPVSPWSPGVGTFLRVAQLGRKISI